MRHFFLILSVGFFPGLSADVSAEEKKATEFTPEQVSFFEKEVQPVLEERCFKCHGDKKKVKGSLRLSTRANVLKGGVVGPAVSLENPEKSLILEMISYKDDEHEMPPRGKLPQAEIDLITRWVKMGLPWTPAAPGEKAHPEKEEVAGEQAVARQGGIAWYGTLTSALAEAKRTGKPILLVSAAPHCHSISGIW